MFVSINILWYICYCVYSWQLDLILGAAFLVIIIIVAVNPECEHVIYIDREERQDIEASLIVELLKSGIPVKGKIEICEKPTDYPILAKVHVAAAAIFFLGMFTFSVLIGVYEVQSDVLILYWMIMTMQGVCLIILLVPLTERCFGKRAAWGRRTNHFEVIFAILQCITLMLVEQGYPPP